MCVRTTPSYTRRSPGHRARKRRVSEVTGADIGDIENSDSDYGWLEDELAAESLVDESHLMEKEPSRLMKKKPIDFKSAHESGADANKVT